MPRDRRAVERALPDARRAITYLTDQGQADLAAAVEEVTGFATETVEQMAHRSAYDAQAYEPNRALKVTAPFKDRVQAGAKASGRDAAQVVADRFRQYLAGTWAPQLPARRRAAPGEPVQDTYINFRLADDLWDAVDTRAKNPAKDSGLRASNAREIARLALDAEFPQPKGTKKKQ